MYRKKDRQTMSLFPELFPLGGGLRAENRWMKLGRLIPWNQMEEVYREHFSDRMGRPAKDSRLICGLLVVKHMKGFSDEEVVEEYLENPYIQAFSGEEMFVTEGGIDPSLLSKTRKRLGKTFFRRFEKDVLEVLKRRRIIRPGEHLLDATVIPVNIEYPTDAKLLNRARRWVVKVINVIRQRCGVKEKVRTYCRKAQWAYLGFQKKRKKTRAMIRLMRGKLLRYLRRNIRQLEELLREHGRRLKKAERTFLCKRLAVVKTIYDQQREMWKTKARSVKDRIVSLHLPHIRPIVRGKDGKEVEFGPKALLSWTDGFGFLDALKFNAHNEGALWGKSLDLRKERFGEYPEESTGDGIFGTRVNRAMLEKKGVRGGVKALGRAANTTENRKWLREKRRLRGSRMEGIIGHAKNHFGLNRIRYTVPDGEEMWIRLGLLAMNLSTALKKAEKRVRRGAGNGWVTGEAGATA
ncbi:MAG TPA: IS5 family transposase [bacterium]